LNSLLFTVIYKTLPNARVPWRAAMIGGLFTAFVWQVGLRLLEMAVISRSYTAYGIVGSFLAIMVWMYYASAVFIMGAELVHYYCGSSGNSIEHAAIEKGKR
jgi:membrane protein